MRGGIGLVSFRTEHKPKDGAARFIGAGPQPSLVRLVNEVVSGAKPPKTAMTAAAEKAHAAIR